MDLIIITCCLHPQIQEHLRCRIFHRDRPTVSIQLPVFNESYVIRRLVSACADMAEAYGIDKVRIQVLDDSTDDTVMEVDKVVSEYRDKHYQY